MEWRHLLDQFGPRWLKTDVVRLPDGTEVDVGARVPYALLALLDLATWRLRYGVRARLTQLAPIDALQYVGRGLDTPQGPDEGNASYRARLETAIDNKRLAGTAWPMLRQIRGYCTPWPVRVRLVNEHGHFYTIDRDGSLSRYRYSAWDWDGARATALAKGYVRTRYAPISEGGSHIGPAIPWGQFWVIVYPYQASATSTPEPWAPNLWDDGGEWGDGNGTWGSTATVEDVFAIRRIVRRFKPDGSRCVSIIISFDDTAYDPSTTAPPLPGGNWHFTTGPGNIVNGALVDGRDPNSLFWDGTQPGSDL